MQILLPIVFAFVLGYISGYNKFRKKDTIIQEPDLKKEESKQGTVQKKPKDSRIKKAIDKVFW